MLHFNHTYLCHRRMLGLDVCIDHRCPKRQATACNHRVGFILSVCLILHFAFFYHCILPKLASRHELQAMQLPKVSLTSYLTILDRPKKRQFLAYCAERAFFSFGVTGGKNPPEYSITQLCSRVLTTQIEHYNLECCLLTQMKLHRAELCLNMNLTGPEDDLRVRST